MKAALRKWADEGVFALVVFAGSAIAGVFAGGLFGAVLSMKASADFDAGESRIDAWADACLAGNANACRLYEVGEQR